MKRLLILPLLAICACSGGTGRNVEPPTPTVAAVRHDTADMSVDEMVDAVPHSTLDTLCANMQQAFDEGASTAEVATVLLDGLEGISGPYSEREVAMAIIAWCVDHGYE